MDWSLLSSLPEDERRALIQGAHRRRFDKGEVVFHEGDLGDTLHLLVRGRVAVRLTTPLGDRTLLRLIGSGGWFGELSLISPYPRSATIIALEPTETLVVSREHTVEMRRRIPEFDAMLVDALVQEVRRLSTSLLDALFVPVDKRLFRRLVELADTYGEGRPGVVIPLTQEEIAQLVGTTRPTANHHLRALVAEGLIAMRRGSIEVLDPVGLSHRAR
jgi:CRP/FNR family transcriptional regulator, cyclic AMP receptor protein